MQLLERERVGILLSLDGERERHDALRGGFDRIRPWFSRLAAQGNTTVAMQVGRTHALARNVQAIWAAGFPTVYLNIVQNYGWYGPEDVGRFETEYDDAVRAMLAGKGELACALAMHRMLARPDHSTMCGITRKGLACDWRGHLYPCHRASELGRAYAIGDIWEGVSERKDRLYRKRIDRQSYGSKEARKHPLVAFCPVSVYQEHGRFGGPWNAAFCEMIELKAKIVAKHHYALEAYRKDRGSVRQGVDIATAPVAPMTRRDEKTL
jgi:radical SAM protein with 4Fe4S-binding SPASM domain